MVPKGEEGLDLEPDEMELDGIDLQGIIDVVHRQDMQSIPP
jgi:hypothetical protein